MDQDQNNFELESADGKIQVRRHSIGAQVIFRVTFSNKRSPLVLTRAAHSTAFNFGHPFRRAGKEKLRK